MKDKKEKLVPELRFSEFEGVWEPKRLRSVLKIGSGKDYKHLNSGDIPVYGTGGYMLSVDDYLYDGESVCIGRKGTIDKPRFLKGKFWTVDTLFYTYKYQQVLPYFIYLLFQRINWLKYNEASGVPSLSKSTIGNIKVNLPSLQEQQKIASFLSLIDKKIELLKKKKELLELYKKGVMQKIFNREISFKDEDGNDYPEWEEKRLGEIVKIRGGYAFKSKKFLNEGVPIIRISNIPNEGRYTNLENLVYYKMADELRDYLIHSGEAIIALSGATTGKVGVLEIKQPAFLNQRVGVFKKDNTKIDYDFLIHYIFSQNFQKEIERFLVAGAQPNISIRDINTIKTTLPSLHEQAEIVGFLNRLFNLTENTQVTLKNMKIFKKGLLQKMFI